MASLVETKPYAFTTSFAKHFAGEVHMLANGEQIPWVKFHLHTKHLVQKQGDYPFFAFSQDSQYYG